MNDEEVQALTNEMVENAKFQYRLEQIVNEGNDPAKTHESFGTPHDLAAAANGQKRVLDEDDPETDKIGRPKERTKYNTDKHVRDRDPIGKKARGKGRDADRTVTHKYKHDSPLAKESKKSQVASITNAMPKVKTKRIIKETFGIQDSNIENGLLDEQNIMDLE